VNIHVYGGTPTAGGTNGTLLSEEISSTLTVAASIGDLTITVEDATNFYADLVLRIETEVATVSSVDYSTNVITLTAVLTVAHNLGKTVINTASDSAPITSTDSVVAGNESGIITLAIRTETGYATSGTTSITPSGTTSDEWQLSLNGTTWLDYGVALTITSIITAVNTLFYARYKVLSSETASFDKTVTFDIDRTIVAV